METTSTEGPPPLSLEDWAAMDEDEPGELVEGILVEEEDVGALHESVVVWLVTIVCNWLGTRGRVLGSDAKLAVGLRRGRKPDISVWLERVKLPARRVIRTPPDVVVEIVSPIPKDRRRDRSEKLLEYASFGIRYYWLVDPEARTFEVLERDERGVYAIVLTATEGVVSVPGCSGLTVDLDALWAELADLEQDD